MGVTLSYSGLGGKVKFSGTSGKFKTVYIRPLLLTLYPGASVAYSLRKISTTYTGSAIRVRRSSDNTETDIGFVNNVLDTASLLTFCGTGNGFVAKWYDQSGNSNHANQATTGNQPQIVNNGSIFTRLGIPYIQASSTQFFQFTTEINTPIGNSYSLWMTYEKDATGNQAIILKDGNNYHWLEYGTFPAISNADNVTISSAYNTNTLYLHNAITNYSVSGTIYRNGTSIGTRGALTTAAVSSILPSNSFRTARITMSEFLFYPSDQTTNRAAIESNINTFYSIYGVPIGTGLIDLYPNTSVAYSLRKLSSTYTGPAIRVRRSSDNAEQNIGFVNNQLDTASLLTFCGAGNGFVTKWYDQSGNANNLIQTNTAQQPNIVVSGALVTVNGKPYVELVAGRILVFSTDLVTPAASNHSLWMVHKQSVTNDNIQMLLAGGSEYHWLSYGTTQCVSNNNCITISSGYVANTMYITNHISKASTSSTIYRNGASIGTTGAINSTARSTTINNTSSGGSTVTMSEFIFYPSDQDTNRTAITSDINSYYSIY